MEYQRRLLYRKMELPTTMKIIGEKLSMKKSVCDNKSGGFQRNITRHSLRDMWGTN